MAYVAIDNFQAGLDDRKSLISAVPGSLVYCNNAHINSGGEIEKRKAFFPFFIFPPNSLPLGCLPGRGNQLYIFGNGDAPVGLPSEFPWVDVRYGGAPAVKMLRAEMWGDQPQAVFEYAGGVTRMYFDTGFVDMDANWQFVDLPRNSFRDLLHYQKKAYVVQGSVVAFSSIGEPTVFGVEGEDHVGAGFIDLSQEGPGAFDLIAAAIYQEKLVVYGKSAMVIMGVDPDPLLTKVFQLIPNFGIAAPRSLVNFGEADTLFLSYAGVRSLRARDSSQKAAINAVGNPIDKTVSNHVQLLVDSRNEVPAVGLYEPREGRYWLALADVIYAFTYFPEARVSAWSTYTPGFEVLDMAATDDKVFVLSHDTLYTYGAYRRPDGVISRDTDYDDSPVEVILPFIDAQMPATEKTFTAVDVGCENVWRMFGACNPSRPEIEEAIGVFGGQSYTQGRAAFGAKSTHVRFRLTCETEGYARLSNLAVHYKDLRAS